MEPVAISGVNGHGVYPSCHLSERFSVIRELFSF